MIRSGRSQPRSAQKDCNVLRLNRLGHTGQVAARRAATTKNAADFCRCEELPELVNPDCLPLTREPWVKMGENANEPSSHKIRMQQKYLG